MLWWFLGRRAPEPTRVLLLAAPDSENLSPQEARMILTYLVDALEVQGPVAVTRLPALPPAGAFAARPERHGLVLQVRLRRVGDRLQLMGTVTSTPDVAQGRPGHPVAGALDQPAAAFQTFLARLPLSLDPRRGQGLWTSRASDFWELTSALSEGLRRDRLRAACARVEALAQQHPDWAEAQYAAGALAQRLSLTGGRDTGELLARARLRFEAATRREPRFARAWEDWMCFLADTGDAREALAAFPALGRTLAHSPNFWVGVGYAARYGGLLPVMRRAADAVERLHLDPEHPWRLQIGLLYLGELDRFDASLWTTPDEPRRPFLTFLRGLVDLIRGRPVDALTHFREGEQDPDGAEQFVRMSGAFRAALEGRREEAEARLQALEDARQSLRAPDGESQIFLAEGWALVGRPDRALDAMERAFNLGFGCTAWFEADPLLAEPRRQARWIRLRQHLHERQALLESRFPVSAFE